MELITKIKKIPKKKLALVCVLVVLVIATVCIALVAAKSRNEPTADGGGGQAPDTNNSVNVFNPTGGEEATSDTVEPIDKSGVAGLNYVSLGNGTCYIDGMGTCTQTELSIPAYSPHGDKVIKISDSAFANCNKLLSVSIPSTVKTIGTGVFRGCSSLVAINVDTENTVYCSVGGVLLTKDKTVLVCLPMSRPGVNYLLHRDTKAIAAYALEGAINLQSILYEGKIADFQEIEILMGNGILDTLTITCNYVSAK